MISPVSAVIQDLGTFKQNNEVNLIQICGSCTFNNITTVLYPNSSVAISNVAMTRDGTFYNYSFLNTNTNGIYIVNGFGDLSGVDTAWSYEFEITPSGIIQKSIFQNTIHIILFILFLTFLLLGIGFKLPSLGFISSIILILLGIYTMIYGFNDMTDLYTQGSALAIIGLGIIFMFISAYEWLPWSGREDN